MYLQELFRMQLPKMFFCNLKPVCANESWSPASVQPLSVVVWGLEHSWSIPLCFHGSVWGLSVRAERSLLTRFWTDRVNVEFTRLAIPHARSLLCLLSVSFLANPSSSPPCFPSLLLCPLSAGIAVGFYGNGETCDGVNRLTYSLRHANRTITGVQKLVRLRAQTVPACLIIHSPSAMSIPGFPYHQSCVARPLFFS